MSDPIKLSTSGELTGPSSMRICLPKPKWEWVVFGDRQLMTAVIYTDAPWWRRTLTKIVLGSRWRKLR